MNYNPFDLHTCATCELFHDPETGSDLSPGILSNASCNAEPRESSKHVDKGADMKGLLPLPLDMYKSRSLRESTVCAVYDFAIVVKVEAPYRGQIMAYQSVALMNMSVATRASHST